MSLWSPLVWHPACHMIHGLSSGACRLSICSLSTPSRVLAGVSKYGNVDAVVCSHRTEYYPIMRSTCPLITRQPRAVRHTFVIFPEGWYVRHSLTVVTPAFPRLIAPSIPICSLRGLKSTRQQTAHRLEHETETNTGHITSSSSAYLCII